MANWSPRAGKKIHMELSIGGNLQRHLNWRVCVCVCVYVRDSVYLMASFFLWRMVTSPSMAQWSRTLPDSTGTPYVFMCTILVETRLQITLVQNIEEGHNLGGIAGRYLNFNPTLILNHEGTSLVIYGREM